MTTSIEKKLINDILEYKLKLGDGTEYCIPVREDGYINATRLCKAGGKRLNNWMRLKETKEMIQKMLHEFNTSHVSQSETKDEFIHSANRELIYIHKGGNKSFMGTFLHPQLAINLCEWLSVDFRIQVSKWIHELIITEKVEIGKEKPSEEIHQKLTQDIMELQKQLEEANQKLSEKEKILQEAEDIILSHKQNEKTILARYEKLYVNHQTFLKRKNLYKLKEGPCVYLLNFPDVNSDGDSPPTKIKIGKTSNITDRISGFRTSNPYVNLLFLVYTPHFNQIESNIKTKFDSKLNPNNHEFFSDITLEELKDSIIRFADMLGAEYSIETKDELDKFNTHIIKIEDVKEEEINKDKLIRCGGHRHKTEEDRHLTTDNFFKNKTNKTGFSRLCKNCILTTIYGENRRKVEKTIVPDYDITTHKWCNRCKNIRRLDEFFNDRMSRDGLCSNCKICKAEQKKLQKLKKQTTTTTIDTNTV
jgi:hypothetical protein